MSIRVGPKERQKIEQSLKKWRVKAKMLPQEDLDAVAWLFESLMWQEKESALRLLMIELYSHIAALQAKLNEHGIQ